jgi:Tol biopolymer transport system component
MRARLAVAVLAFSLLVLPAGASGHWGNGARILSGSLQRGEQADAGTQSVAISPDGRYVAFQTRARNLFPDSYVDPDGRYTQGGLFRSDLETGALELIALGDARRVTDDALVTRGAQDPSISADGRYIAFSTAYQLAPADTNPNLDIYVRDMSRPIDDPAAFELASALDGTDSPPAYTSTAGTAGSVLTRGASLSADGQKVIFRTTSISTFSGPSTPVRQLYVRDRAAKTTTLVTRTIEGAPAGGAKDGALSADGTTVAWTGSNAGLQTRSMNGERPDAGLDFYLWRRVADGPAAETRRIAGKYDPDDPACPPDEVVQNVFDATGPCYGFMSFYEGEIPYNVDGKVPALSADGWRVVFVSRTPVRPTNQGNNHDLFVTDMRPGVTRKLGTLELTREGTITTDEATSAQIDTLALSADGNRIAFTTVRSQFILSSPRLLDDPVSVPPAVTELYLLDLPSMTLQRVTRAYDGGEIDRGVVDGVPVSISGDGRRIAFVSGATNLVLGDANEDQDAFVATQPGSTESAALLEPPFVGGSSSRPGLGGAKKPRLAVRVARTHAGLRVTVKAPGPGRVRVRARSRVAVKGAGRERERTVASKTARTSAAGRATIVLTPARRYRSLVRRTGRLRARLEVTFTSSGLRLTVRRSASFTS